MKFPIEVLLSTMNQSTFDIYNKMNIQTDAIIVNQTNYFGYKEREISNSTVRMFSFDEKGIGLSRNTALMRAKNEICLLADDDLVYQDDYTKIIDDAFKNNTKADIIIFDVVIKDKFGIRNKVQKNGRVFWFNALRYGAVSIAFRKNSVEKANIKFNTLFGGGAKYGSGEDSLFIWECLKKGLKIYSCTDTIATVYNDGSTWFKGYDEKYLYDKGALFKAISTKLYFFLNVQFALKNINRYKGRMNILSMIKTMSKGSGSY